MKDFFFVLINEFLSYFVPQKVEYEVTGECKKCGKCCNYMYSYDTYTEREFKFMQLLFPSYRRFYIKGKDAEGNFIFACKLVTPEGLCPLHNRRPRMCRNYPARKISYPGKLHDGCGYKVNAKTFDDFIKKY
jgi:Fe-S-cluster containining protein